MNFIDKDGNDTDGGKIIAHGGLFMITLVGSGDNKFLTLWLEDDDNWFEVATFDRLWLADLKSVVDITTNTNLS